jgi:hypothetical protein
MEAGITLANWFKHEALRLYAMLDESDASRDQRRLTEWIVAKGVAVTARDVQRGCSWLKGPGAAERALEEMVRSGRGQWDQSEPGQRGQPTRRFKLSTLIDTIDTDSNAISFDENTNTVDVDTVNESEFEPPTVNKPSDLFHDPTSPGPYGDGY